MLRLLAAVACVALVNAVPIDNGVEGDPEIECGPTSITINFNTQNTFEGHVYVKGLYAQQQCRNDDGGRQVAGINLPFDSCNVRRQRSLNPKGVFVSTTIIISFHPLFITKADRAYTIQCFYMEADKTVDTRLEVSMLTTEFQTQVVPMPVCRYDILDGGPNGAPVEYALVGQQVFHKWTCDTETIDTFCMVVYSCFVDDTNGDTVDLINEQGCANDLYLMNNPEYPSDLMAGVEAHVFKYADRADLYFQCQINILVKEPNEDCPRPVCGSPAGRGAGGANPAPGPARQQSDHAWPLSPGSPYLQSRKKRDTAANLAGTVDVLSHMSALDIQDRNTRLPTTLSHLAVSKPSQVQQGLCFSPTTISVFMVLTIGMLLAVASLATFLVLRRGK
jgi:hypothetical protein